MPGHGNVTWKKQNKQKTKSQRHRERASRKDAQGSIELAKEYTLERQPEIQKSPIHKPHTDEMDDDVVGTDHSFSGVMDISIDQAAASQQRSDVEWLEDNGYVERIQFDAAGDGFVYVRREYNHGAPISENGGSTSHMGARLASRSFFTSPSRGGFSANTRLGLGSPPSRQNPTPATISPVNTDSNGAPITLHSSPDSNNYYHSSSGISRPTNDRQKARLRHAWEDPQPRRYTNSRHDDRLNPSYSPRNAPLSDITEWPRLPNTSVQHQRDGGLASILEVETIHSTFSADNLATASPYKTSSSSSGPSSSFNIGQPPQEQGSETQSQFATILSPLAAPYIPLTHSIESQSHAATQLEVTSDPIANSFDLSRYKDLASTPLCPLPLFKESTMVNHSEDNQLQTEDTSGQMDDTSAPQMESTGGSHFEVISSGPTIDATLRSDDSPPVSISLHSTPPGEGPPIMDSSTWHHVRNIHPPSVDLSDSSSQLSQYEQYIKTHIDLKVTEYIMSNTPLSLPSFLSISSEPTMSLEVLPRLTPEYCQEYSYFLLRLQGLMRDIKALSVDNILWKTKQRQLINDLKASFGWMRRKMDERIQAENKALKMRQKELVEELMGSPDKGKGKEERTRRDSGESTSSSIDSNVVRAVEGGINAMFEEDDEEELVTAKRWDEEGEEAERLALNKEPTTPAERVNEEGQSTERSLERYIAAGTTLVESHTPPGYPTPSLRASRAPTPQAAVVKTDTSPECIARVGWVGKETEHLRTPAHLGGDTTPVTTAHGGNPALLSSGSTGAFTGSHYGRTRTIAPVDQKTDQEMEASLQADADDFFNGPLPPTPSPAPRNVAQRPSIQFGSLAEAPSAYQAEKDTSLPRTVATNTLNGRVMARFIGPPIVFGDLGEDVPGKGKDKDMKMEKESTHPFIAKTPPKSPDIRAQQFVAAMTARGIRVATPSDSILTAETANTRPQPVVKLPVAGPDEEMPAPGIVVKLPPVDVRTSRWSEMFKRHD